MRQATTNLVHRPCDGRVLTASGRSICQPPCEFDPAPENRIAYDTWLLIQGQQEALVANDEWMIRRLFAADAASMDAELRRLLNDFLFGDVNPEFGIKSV